MSSGLASRGMKAALPVAASGSVVEDMVVGLIAGCYKA